MTAPHMPMMNDDGLLECAHCASINVGFESDEDGLRYIECHDCMIRTDGYRNHTLIRSIWNTRNSHLWTEQDFKDAAWEQQNSDLLEDKS